MKVQTSREFLKESLFCHQKNKKVSKICIKLNMQKCSSHHFLVLWLLAPNHFLENFQPGFSSLPVIQWKEKHHICYDFCMQSQNLEKLNLQLDSLVHSKMLFVYALYTL